MVLGLMIVGPAGCVVAGPPLGGPSLAPQSSTLFQCGPTTLAAVLAFHGEPVPEVEISRAIYSPTARGVLLTDLAWYARARGFRTEVRTGTLRELQAALTAGHPPIVLLDLGIAGVRQPHFTAVTGWGGGRLRYLSPRPAGVELSEQNFQRQWSRAGNQYLLITPAS